MNPSASPSLGPGILLTLTVLLSACSTRYVDQSHHHEEEVNPLTPKVLYQVHDLFHQPVPQCVAVLPLRGKVEPNKMELVRRALYAHLSPHGFRDIELPRIDHVIRHNGLDMTSAADRAALGELLHCDAVIIGQVNNHDSRFYGIYSKVEVHARLQMVRVSNDTLLWEAEHHASLEDGGLPLSPISIAAGLFSAARNVDDEQMLRVVDDLARRLVHTLPEVTFSFNDDERIDGLFQSSQATWNGDLEQHLKNIPRDEQTTVIRNLVRSRPLSNLHKEQLYHRLTTLGKKARDYRAWGQLRQQQGDYEGALELYSEASRREPTDAESWFLRGRMLIHLDRLDEADQSLVQAIAHNPDHDRYYAALGYVNSIRSNPDRARASYRLALQHNPENGFAWYNLAVSDYNEGDLRSAIEHFNNAGEFYLKQSRYDRVEQVISDLSDLQKSHRRNVRIKNHIEHLQQGLKQAVDTSISG